MLHKPPVPMLLPTLTICRGVAPPFLNMPNPLGGNIGLLLGMLPSCARLGLTLKKGLAGCRRRFVPSGQMGLVPWLACMLNMMLFRRIVRPPRLRVPRAVG